jgi:protein-disulfide isomerase
MINQQDGVLALPVEAGDHATGAADAPVTLVEYGDYECPWCARVYPIVKRIQQTMSDSVRVVFRHFPRNSIHPHSGIAAQAAEAAAAQGRFWPMHEMLFENQDELAEVDLAKYALRLGLEVYKFQADIAADRYAAKVRRDYDSAVASGVKKTPTLFINGIRYEGALEYDALVAALLSARIQAATQQPATVEPPLGQAQGCSSPTI